MIATFWNILNSYADRSKKTFGAESVQYKTVQEIEKLLQFAYDNNNQFDKIELKKKPETDAEAYIFDRLPDVLVFKDEDGYYFEIDGHHKDNASEVLDYIVEDRANKYKKLKNKYINKFNKAIDETVSDWAGTMKQSLEINLQNVKDTKRGGANNGDRDRKNQ